MKLTLSALAPSVVAAEEKDNRQNLEDVVITPTGKVWATNGAAMAVFNPAGTGSVVDEGAREGLPITNQEVKLLRKMLSPASKGLSAVANGPADDDGPEEDDKVRWQVGENVVTTARRQPDITGWFRVFNPAVDRESVETWLSIKVLADMVKAFKAAGCKYVNLRLPYQERQIVDADRLEVSSSLSEPTTWTGKNVVGDEMTMVIMPSRM